MKNEEHTTICRDENGTVYARTPLYGSEELFTDAKRQEKDKKDIVYIVLNVVAILLLLAFFVFCAIVNGIGDNKEKKIEQAVIEELKLQATDYGDGDYYDEEETAPSNSDELVRVTAERDTYKKLYESLVEKLVGVMKKESDK